MELYLGTKTEQKFIRDYLRDIRTKTPQHLINVSKHSTLFRVLSKKGADIINAPLLEAIINNAEAFLKAIDDRFELIDARRYYICEGIELDDLGGFHGRRKGGYLYMHNIGIAYLLKREFVNNHDIATLELAKNYIHDSIHSSTFRSIRVMPKVNFTEFQVYREQYGINFRKPDGTSFSSVDATKKSPLSINLNLLMDGVADKFAEVTLKKQSPDINIVGTSELESAIINQLYGLGFDDGLYSQPNRFLNEVTRPTKLFIDYWDINHSLYELILRAMLSGDLSDVKQFFAGKLNNRDAWDIIFRRPTF